MTLMAGEVVSLMLQVPRFFDSLLSDDGIIQLVTTAVGDRDVVERAQDKLIEGQYSQLVTTAVGDRDVVERAQDKLIEGQYSQKKVGVSKLDQQYHLCVNQASKFLFQNNPPLHVIHKLVSDLVITAITKRLDTLQPKMTHIPIGDRYLALSDSLPIKPLHSVIWASRFLTNGETIPNLEPPILNPVREAAKPKPIPPKMGDKVLLGPQVVGELASLLEGDIAMVKIDAVPVSNGAVESKLKSSDAHFAYVDLKALCFAKDIGMWRPAKTVGDKYTIHSTDYSHVELPSAAKKEKEPLMFTTPDEFEKFQVVDLHQHMSSSAISSFVLTSQMVHRSQSVGTGYLTGYRHTLEEQDFDLVYNFNQSGNKDAPLSARNNNHQLSNSKMLQQKKRILSAPPTSSTKSRVVTAPQQKAIEMNTLHLHDNVHHIRGLTPRVESERSGALTSPSTTASHREEVQGETEERPSNIHSNPSISSPDISRTNTPVPATDKQVSVFFSPI
ncbi:Dnaj-like protein subfamily c member 14 [Plakobranchus ocellatus]|uniref:Dnaj-like protein subfamily c member 14 n=1 Tax=Plakobranchus ocellatus TaxID=259542 RepID=A0AAV4BKQ2_9GAST|nr:Dnaj-like protein subfamily c member 14 [Plakobranchus ocellatus]